MAQRKPISIPAPTSTTCQRWISCTSSLKVLYLDRTGVCVFAKRVHRGRFEFTFEGSDAAATVTLDGPTLAPIVNAAQCHAPSGADREKEPATRAKKRVTRTH